MIRRGGIHWVDLGPPQGSRPAKQRPVVVIQSDRYNATRIATVLAAIITSNLNRALLPGNVFLPAAATGLPRDSVVNVTALVTVNRGDLGEEVGRLPPAQLRELDTGLRQVLGL